VGVFVDPGLDELVRVIARCSLQAVQLHGVESPDFVTDLRKRTGTRIIKTLFAARAPGLADAQRYDVAAYLVECGKGRLPGGNAMRWNWALAEPFGRQHPMVLAGGLAPATVARAISACLPDAVDASSGLEAAPGHKDLAKVNAFIETVHQTSALYDAQEKEIQTIF
jgi:phosphoribosylanthranilate isomerase/indole-3-glycerol phosphate synthase/phosphoribosylanthranilate isomerase